MKLLSLKKNSAGLHVWRYGKLLKPSRDWFVLLTIWLILLGISIGYHVWLFTRVTGGESLEPITTTVQQGDLNSDAATQVFEVREGQRAQYLETYRFVDPSR